MRILFYAIIATIACGMTGCSAENSGNNASTPGISGHISDAMSMKVFLDKTDANNNTLVLGQTETDPSGKFSIELAEPFEPGLYRLRIGAKRTMLVLEDNVRHVNIEGDLASLGNYAYTISGSKSAGEFTQIMNDLNTRQVPESEIKDFIQSTDYPYAGMQLALSSFGNRPEYWETHKVAADRVLAKYQEDKLALNYATFAKQLEQTYLISQARNKIKVGEVAPDIVMESPEGTTYKLSDLKGKIVLIDFWASWCGPCRKNNPHVVDVYNKYKDRGFTVYSVSLDGVDERTKKRMPNPDMIEQTIERSKQRWIDAIEKDNLTWEYHVSDLAKWDTKAAKMYGVTGIPKTFLVDRNGKIAAVNPRYDLEEQLVKIL